METPMTPDEAVRDVDEQGFAAEVVEESRRRPVLVDFWAAWCAPCRALGPVLEKVARECGGALRLAKVDVDKNQGLAQRFGVRGIPAVFLFVDGAPVDGFTGALPEREVRAFLKKHVKSEADRRVDEARRLLDAAPAEAAAIADAVLTDEPRHGRALVVRADAALRAGDQGMCEAMLDRVPPNDDAATKDAEVVRARLAFARLAGDEDEATLKEKLARSPDPQAALRLAARAALHGRFDEAFDKLLLILVERGPAREEAHEAALAILKLLPDDKARDLRRRLSNALY